LALSPGFFETTYGINEISYCVLMLWPALGYWFGSFLIKHSACPTKLAHTSIIASGLVALIVILIGVVAPSIPLWAVIAILCMQFIGVGAAIPYSQNGQVSLPLALPGVSTGLFSLFK
jgi:MFS transporter